MGDNKVNIADMTLGRIIPGGYAVIVLNLDEPLPPGVLEELNRMENVVEAKIVDL